MKPVPLLSLRGVSKRFGGVVALDAVDWDVLPGEVHCLVGENGCGKSTLIKIVAGVHKPSEGSIAFDGAPALPLTPAKARALGVQVIFQDLSLFPNLNVAENIAIATHLERLARPVSHAALRRIAITALQRLDVRLDPDALVADLSVAERQIVAICRGLAAAARLIVMDEPTASLTRAEVNRLLAAVTRLQADGIAVVFVSHRLDEVTEIAERVTVLRDGRKVGTLPAGDVDQRRIAHLMTGLAFEPQVVARDLGGRAALLEVDGLTRDGEFAEIGFSLRRGEVLGIAGLLGAGRTELALTLFGMARADRGTIRLDGAALQLNSNRDALRAGIAYVSEDRLSLGLILRQSIADNIVLAKMKDLAGPLGLISGPARRGLARTWIDRLGIKAAAPERPVNTLSGGNQQRVVLAKWLATEPKVLILDSPTVGVDIRNKQGIYEVVAQLADAGVGVILISDEVAELLATCDRVLHMREGRLVAEHVPGQVTEHALEAAIYA